MKPNEVLNLDSLPNIFRVYTLDDNPNWLLDLAKSYIELRSSTDFPLSQISLDGITVVNTDQIKSRLAKATLPKLPNPITNFSVVRSDFGELLCYILNELLFKTSFGYKSIRDRELIDLPGRGIDAIGIEELPNGKFNIVISEVKVSNDSASPPQVVDSPGDSLRTQHLNHLKNLDKTTEKVWDLSRRTKDQETQKLFLRVAMCLEMDRKDLLSFVTCSLLVRPKDKYQNSDFGSFLTTPNDYVPASIRFIIVRIPDSVNPTVANWYKQMEAVLKEYEQRIN